MNIYEVCPEVRNDRFLLRLVGEQDCEDLLKVYSDLSAVPLFNSDNCNGDDFYYATPERMREAVAFWMLAYENGWFVRLSIVDVAAGCAVGTVELCRRESGDTGILRLDLRSDYEKEAVILELLSLVAEPAYDFIGCSLLITKAKPIAAARIRALTAFEFSPADTPLIGNDGKAYGDYYERRKGK